MQLGAKKRGFSFMREGPLDMRMDPSSDLTAGEIVNTWSEFDLGRLLKEYGEERHWRRAARAIVDARRKKRIETTVELADILSKAVRCTRRRRFHPATLTFQALRLAVNQELASIGKGVREAICLLASKGRVGVLSFHSLEDRIVKRVFNSFSKPVKKMAGMRESHLFPTLKVLNKKPLLPSINEIRGNRRARSAKLRIAERG